MFELILKLDNLLEELRQNVDGGISFYYTSQKIKFFISENHNVKINLIKFKEFNFEKFSYFNSYIHTQKTEVCLIEFLMISGTNDHNTKDKLLTIMFFDLMDVLKLKDKSLLKLFFTYLNPPSSDNINFNIFLDSHLEYIKNQRHGISDYFYPLIESCNFSNKHLIYIMTILNNDIFTKDTLFDRRIYDILDFLFKIQSNKFHNHFYLKFLPEIKKLQDKKSIFSQEIIRNLFFTRFKEFSLKHQKQKQNIQLFFDFFQDLNLLNHNFFDFYTKEELNRLSCLLSVKSFKQLYKIKFNTKKTEFIRKEDVKHGLDYCMKKQSLKNLELI